MDAANIENTASVNLEIIEPTSANHAARKQTLTICPVQYARVGKPRQRNVMPP
jgi:hypothetical protein